MIKAEVRSGNRLSFYANQESLQERQANERAASNKISSSVDRSSDPRRLSFSEGISEQSRSREKEGPVSQLSTHQHHIRASRKTFSESSLRTESSEGMGEGAERSNNDERDRESQINTSENSVATRLVNNWYSEAAINVTKANTVRVASVSNAQEPKNVSGQSQLPQRTGMAKALVSIFPSLQSSFSRSKPMPVKLMGGVEKPDEARARVEAPDRQVAEVTYQLEGSLSYSTVPPTDFTDVTDGTNAINQLQDEVLSPHTRQTSRDGVSRSANTVQARNSIGTQQHKKSPADHLAASRAIISPSAHKIQEFIQKDRQIKRRYYSTYTGC